MYYRSSFNTRTPHREAYQERRHRVLGTNHHTRCSKMSALTQCLGRMARTAATSGPGNPGDAVRHVKILKRTEATEAWGGGKLVNRGGRGAYQRFSENSPEN